MESKKGKRKTQPRPEEEAQERVEQAADDGHISKNAKIQANPGQSQVLFILVIDRVFANLQHISG